MKSDETAGKVIFKPVPLQLSRKAILDSAKVQTYSKTQTFSYMRKRLRHSLEEINATPMEAHISTLNNYFDLANWMLKGTGLQAMFYTIFIVPMVIIELISQLSESVGLLRSSMKIPGWHFTPLKTFLPGSEGYSGIPVPQELLALKKSLDSLTEQFGHRVDYSVAWEGLDLVVSMHWKTGWLTREAHIIYIYNIGGRV